MRACDWLAVCPRGLAPTLAAELAELGADAVTAEEAAVRFRGPAAVMYRACLWSRVANRILLPVAEFPAGDGDDLYRELSALAWPALLAPGATIAVDFHGSSEQLRHTRFGAQRCKDAIVDSCRAAGRERPGVDLRRPDLRISVQFGPRRVAVALDLAGGSLHQRGYRARAGAAPLKENLAAGILLLAGWPALAARGAALFDPLCGSGTLLLEGAMIAADLAPGLGRTHWGFRGWAGHDERQWTAIYRDARARGERGRARALPEIRGYDADPRVVDAARDNVARLDLGRVVRIGCKTLAAVRRPTHRPLETGLLLCNPPYGERLGDRDSLPQLYARLGRLMHDEFSGWQGAVLTGDKALGKATGLRSHRQHALYNGALAVSLLLFDLGPENRLRDPAPAPAADAGTRRAGADPAAADAPGATMFANRLRKNARRLRRWRQRQGVTAYRLYDADLPEYAFAVDIYGDRVQVAEYAPPAGVDAAAAQRRREEVAAVLPAVLAVPGDRVVHKTRQRQRGSAQYQRRGRRGDFFAVEEGGASLLVNLHDYLDTGLFLDHRPLRRRIGAEARGRDFLNLFCYTGSATVHAALGGARHTTSVDLSNTYLAWLRRNLAQNGLGEGGRHRVVRADVRRWLAAAGAGGYDLVLLDPPSFSNSSAVAESFDLQRDHRPLVEAALACLRPGGVLYFSSNRRRFRLDPALAGRDDCRDVSAETIDPDFARRPRIHRCWRFGP